jgi:predicted dehydrogenase
MGSKHRAAVAPLKSIEVAAASNWRELVDHPDLDGIDICLPTDLHAEVAAEALGRGKHVFCEKPMALAPADCEWMIRAAEQNCRVLMIGHVLRFWPEYLELKQFIEEHRQAITSVTFFRRSSVPDWGLWLTDEMRSGGAILDLLVHDIDQALLLFGTPQWVSARSLGPVDTMEARMEYSGSLAVHIRGGWYPEGTAFQMEVIVTTTHDQLTITPSLGDGAYRAELEYFVECSRANRFPELCPPQAAAQAVKLALLLKESRDRGEERLPCVL